MISVWLLRLLPWVLLAALCGTAYWYVTALQESKEAANARAAQLQTSLDGHLAANRALRGNLQALQDAINEREAARATETPRRMAEHRELKNEAQRAPAAQEWAVAAVPGGVRGVLKAASGADAPGSGSSTAPAGPAGANPDPGVRSGNEPRTGAMRPRPPVRATFGKRG